MLLLPRTAALNLQHSLSRAGPPGQAAEVVWPEDRRPWLSAVGARRSTNQLCVPVRLVPSPAR